MAKSRVLAAYLFVIIGFLLLVARYAYLQIFQHKSFLTKSTDNYLAIVSTEPVRGGILDRNGIVLARNKVSYAIAVLPKDVNDSNTIFQKIAKLVKLSALDKKKYFKQLNIAKKYEWVIIKDGLTEKEVADISAYAYLFPEIELFAHTKRYYPFNELYAPSIGYVGIMSKNDKEKLTKSRNIKNYLPNDYLGKGGLEEQYESILRGKLGNKKIRTDAYGNEVGLISNDAAVDGYTLQLTLDNNLQHLAANLLGNRKGAIVALDPTTGGVLAFISNPTYDANLFIDGISLEDWKDLHNDDSKPLLNRALQSAYPPGSTLKPFIAIAALHLGIRTPSWTMTDKGYFTLPGSNHKFRNSRNEAPGEINIIDAIRISSDVFFYKLGVDLGIDNIDQILAGFGFGEVTGIDLPYENSGLLPSKQWKAKRFSHDIYQKKWQLADSVNVAVGQGFMRFTPLQMAFAVSILANNGIINRPHFMDKILDKNGKVIKDYTTTNAANLVKLNISPSAIQVVKHAMQLVVQSGTARSVGGGLGYTMAGKTGTAQVVSLAQDGRKRHLLKPKYQDHSWFIAFAPVDKPKIAVAILIENGGWGVTAAPIARKLFDKYLLKPDLPNNPKLSNDESVESK